MGILWSEEEDRICCEAVVRDFVKSNTNKAIADVLDEICAHKEIKHGKNVVRMRLSHIKHLLTIMNVQNSLPLSPLSHAGKQTERILRDVLR